MKVLKTIIKILFLLTMGFFLGIEVMIGIFNRHRPQFERASSPGSQKVETLIKAIDLKYVDVVDMDSIMDRVLPTILEELDPHSAYYPAEETQESNDELHGSFSGIGAPTCRRISARSSLPLSTRVLRLTPLSRTKSPTP